MMPKHKNKKSKTDSRNENIIVCRCQDITLAEIEDAIDQGMTHPEEIKRFLHVGMGPCQGRTCGRLIARLIAKKTGKPIHELRQTKPRPPLISVPIKSILQEKDEESV
jgi:bacterioferritin-associated ferredoxin